MSRAAPPGKERRSAANRAPSKTQKDKADRSIQNSGIFAKQLLKQSGPVWLFEIREGRRITYIVKLGERRWSFGLLYPAEAKFARLAGGTPKTGGSGAYSLL
jgi:hypothetical protein